MAAQCHPAVSGECVPGMRAASSRSGSPHPNPHTPSTPSAGRVAEGIAAYERALALAPRHAEALYNLGVAYTEEGHLDRAMFLCAALRCARCAALCCTTLCFAVQQSSVLQNMRRACWVRTQ